jgi:hypothetical protein
MYIMAHFNVPIPLGFDYEAGHRVMAKLSAGANENDMLHLIFVFEVSSDVYHLTPHLYPSATSAPSSGISCICTCFPPCDLPLYRLSCPSHLNNTQPFLPSASLAC